MNRCPITYELCGDKKYSDNGLLMLSRNLKNLKDLQLTQEEQIREAAARAVKMSIQGVQPKLSAKLSVKDGEFQIVDNFGTFILKPQSNIYKMLPENEDLTMKLAYTAGLEVPVHGLVYSIDGKLTYFIKRFDRYSKNKKYSLEDFAQLAGKSRDTKYDYSMEKLKTIIEKYCTFPVIEFAKLFRLTLFNFLVGNEDQHLKNFSLISRNNKVELSPVYDLINTTAVISNPREEIALSLNGKKRNLTKKLLIDYWGKEKLGLNEKTVSKICDEIEKLFGTWNEVISNSFLSDELKEKYKNLVSERAKILFN